MNSGLPASAAPLGVAGIPNVKVKFCRYYAKDKTCFYGEECQFLHEDPSMSGLPLHGGGGSPVPMSMAGGGGTPAVFSLGGSAAACPGGGGTGVSKKSEPLGPTGASLEGQLLSIPGMEGATLSDANLTNSYFSSSFIGVNGFGSPAETKYSMMQRMTTSSSSPSLNDCAKNFSRSTHDPVNSPTSSLFSDFGALSISQRRKTPNPAASEFIPKGAPRMATMVQSTVQAFPSPLFPHPGLPTSTAAALAPGMSLSAGSSPLHSPKITPHTSPAPRRRSHTPNPANYMVPTSAADQGPHMIQKETVGGTTYFYTDNTPAPMAGMVFPTYHIYPPTAPHVAYMQPKANAPSFFMADELRQELINRHLITMAQIDHSENTDVPSEVDSYHSLFPLEALPPPNRMQKTSNFSYITSCYKAVNSKDDLPYCLRRIHGFRLVNTKCMMLVDMWKKIQHSNSVTLREVFTTKAFGDHSLVFSYDFHAGAETMFGRHFSDPAADSYFTKRKWGELVYRRNEASITPDAHLQPSASNTWGQHEPPPPRQHAGLLPESLIWAYIVQLSSALRTIHTAGLACRVMDPSKILITGKTRLRVNCVGVFDVLTFDSSQTNHLALMPQYQQADLVSLGKVVLALACNSLAGIQRENLQKAMELVSINYSSDLKNLILYLLTEQSRLRSVNDIMPMIGARFYTQLDASQMRNDVIEEDLAKEVQNGRLFRLLAKLGTINERPEFQKDPSWSETGDRYLLKLFRDHLFHQVTEAGTPWIDLSHIVSCLNKLDAGVPEKISLVSRDEKSVLVVTYSDLKRCFDSTFQELQAAASGSL
uniref:PAN2-PAN3 deadenylation complex subunit PAN3 n=1 Tax=Gasterosteus aculeatus aculeatus TaxID=481459 RepID=A0AAQ4Q3S8_GASAC|nr:PAN2-PAN3 deadenylation complex subunit PAN3 isoform X2 [Gasterosteus aculeatus aculeatus]